jgi:hypothetical protein
MPNDKFVDYVKLRKEEDGWWYDEYSNNHETVGNSDQGYKYRWDAIEAARKKHGSDMKILTTTGDPI